MNFQTTEAARGAAEWTIGAMAPKTTTTPEYYSGDQIGSERLLMAYEGFPAWWGTYLPLGTELNPQLTVNHYKFTSKERDAESNLDNFGARHYASSYGRFMSPDPANAGADIGSPQSWNGYSYVLNNPETNTDSDGRDTYACLNDDQGQCLDFANEQGLRTALQGTGAFLQNGQILVDVGGQTLTAGTYQSGPGPYDEAGGVQSDMFVNGLIGGVAAAGVDAVAGLAGLAENRHAGSRDRNGRGDRGWRRWEHDRGNCTGGRAASVLGRRQPVDSIQ